MQRWFILVIAAVPLMLGLLKPPAAPALIWWTTHGVDKIRPLDGVPEDLSHSVKISAARNEFEPFQVVLRADGRDIDGIDIEVTDLRNGSSVIRSDKNVSVYLERFLTLVKPSSVASAGTGEWPDPLVPRIDRYTNEKRSAFPFKLTAGRNQPVWIDVYVPPSSAPGIYRGHVRVLVGGKAQLNIPIDLEVWNFETPSTSSLITTFGFSGNLAVRGHYDRYTNDKDVYDLTNLYNKAALWHRISLDTSAGVAPAVSTTKGEVQIRWDAYDASIKPFMDGTVFLHGQPLYGAKATSVALRTPQSLTTADQRMQFWRQAASHFRRMGWFDRMFNYLWDEPKASHYPAMIELGRTIRRADPTVKNLVTAQLRGDWMDFIDIWTPNINCFEAKPREYPYCDPMVSRTDYDPELSRGKDLWWYQACSSHGCYIVGGEYFRGWPSYMIDDAPVRNRIMEWITWKYGVRGELYFATNEAYSKKKDPWKDVHMFGGNGDGTLFYPGRPDIIGGTTQIPIESIRLKLIREGLEDYEYLVLLTKLAGRQVVEDSVDSFIKNTYDYDQNPEKLYAVREWMAKEITRRTSRR